MKENGWNEVGIELEKERKKRKNKLLFTEVLSHYYNTQKYCFFFPIAYPGFEIPGNGSIKATD